MQIVRDWEHSKCPSRDNWLRILWYVPLTQKYYAAVAKNEDHLHVLIWGQSPRHTVKQEEKNMCSAHHDKVPEENTYVELLMTHEMPLRIWTRRSLSHQLLPEGRIKLGGVGGGIFYVHIFIL